MAAAAARVEFRKPNPKEIELSGITPGRVQSGAEPEDLTDESGANAGEED
ncbi:hypothetical protein MTP03_18860 [Tsukamurella sp. PLM1]|nr:hypothetical protein MTP03_18860 [Tsukamurella sp. PLM1]